MPARFNFRAISLYRELFTAMNKPEITGNDTTNPEGQETGAQAPQDMPAATGEASLSLGDLVGVHTGAGEALPPPLTIEGAPRRKRGRPRKDVSAQTAPPEIKLGDNAQAAPTQKLTPAQKKSVKVSSDAAARQILGVTVGTLVGLIGEEWDFESQAEADNMRAALAAYLEAGGGLDVSPTMALTMAAGGYALPRLKHQNTRQKLGAFFKSGIQAILGVFRR